MDPLPQNSTGPLQSYIEVFYTDDSNADLDKVILAPATNTFGYQAGCILAQYTGGGNIGQFVNYVPSASNGQGTPVAVLVDNYLLPSQSAPSSSGGLGTVGTGYAKICYGNARLILSALYWTTPIAGDNVTGLIGFGSNQMAGTVYGQNPKIFVMHGAA